MFLKYVGKAVAIVVLSLLAIKSQAEKIPDTLLATLNPLVVMQQGVCQMETIHTIYPCLTLDGGEHIYLVLGRTDGHKFVPILVQRIDKITQVVEDVWLDADLLI